MERLGRRWRPRSAGAAGYTRAGRTRRKKLLFVSGLVAGAGAQTSSPVSQAAGTQPAHGATNRTRRTFPGEPGSHAPLPVSSTTRRRIRGLQAHHLRGTGRTSERRFTDRGRRLPDVVNVKRASPESAAHAGGVAFPRPRDAVNRASARAPLAPTPRALPEAAHRPAAGTITNTRDWAPPNSRLADGSVGGGGGDSRRVVPPTKPDVVAAASEGGSKNKKTSHTLARA
ncbi:MAG: hypothetical protein BJ554DRAFT_3458 [Olpidium bornovanus]|uniref:Uncharacterized protein n=1 Tax=Olpidium bornovanus TaxID=278681 RepID=A0A8H7ZNQ9_9FUNG|nr:MAG: hypothetical protein BJ554DRAFT_3458 [Olpidium bornovanus]